MDIEIVAAGYLREHLKQGGDLPRDQWAGEELGELMASLPIPPDLAYVPLVNGERQPKSYRLQEGDLVKLIPLVTGG